NLKTDKSGGFLSVGVTTGSYKISLIQNGQVLFFFNNVTIHLLPENAPNVIDFNLAKEHAGQGTGHMTAEQQKQTGEAQKRNAEAAKERAEIGSLNKMLTDAAAAEQAGNWDQAVTILTQAAQTAPNRDLLWARLGGAELGAGDATKTSSKEQSDQHYQKSATDYQKAVQLLSANPNPTPDQKKQLAGYHNNLGQAYAKTGKPQEAMAEYNSAAQMDPPNAAMYYFNLGATLTNSATREQDQQIKTKDIEEANAAFDKAIAAKPDYSEAYYQKAINLLSKATFDKTGKMVPAEGTVDAFNKYLEVDPQGKHAEEAKSIIASLGEKVQTTYKKGKSK
ncbi:MAG TPA: tetratricopeptide repeat protein, partial [Terriglobales bacterium]|nr:tetratricopeptide repeat protein [Terriglobales bacterium]